MISVVVSKRLDTWLGITIGTGRIEAENSLVGNSKDSKESAGKVKLKE